MKADKKMGIEKAKYKPLPHRVPSRKKKRKDKKPWQETYHICPFCSEYLGKIEPDKPHWYVKNTGRGYGVSVDNVNTKCKCGAFEVPNSCPCCKRDTWFLPDDGTITTGVYAHNRGCGFKGRKLLR